MANIVIEGLTELRRQFQAFPRQYKRAVTAAMDLTLLKIWENVEPYPDQTETKSGYIRTGTLGRSLGVSMSGGKSGKPDIYEVKHGSRNFVEASFGTRLNYAPHVIGDAGSEQSREMKRRGWWTLPQTVLSKARDGILTIFGRMAGEMALFLMNKRRGG